MNTSRFGEHGWHTHPQRVAGSARLVKRCRRAARRVFPQVILASSCSRFDRRCASCRRNDVRSATWRRGKNNSPRKESLPTVCRHQSMIARAAVALIAKSSVAIPTKRERSNCSRRASGRTRHGVKETARQTFARPCRVIDVLTQSVVQSLEIACAAAKPLFRIPARVKPSGTEDRFQARGPWKLRIKNRAAHLQMWIERFARDEEPHDFARTFKDQVNAAIAQKSLDRDWLFPRAASDCAVS